MDLFRKAIFVVVYKLVNQKPEYLILKRKKHWKGWEFTKGGIEKGESKEETVKREVKEETGLKIKKLNKFNIQGKYFYKNALRDRKETIGQTYCLYSAEVFPGRVIFDKREHSKYIWLNYENAEKKLTWSNQKRCLKIVNQKLTNRKI
jgi:8-oxo-dGTP pyrophosphatase MutT (NUDIX family)